MTTISIEVPSSLVLEGKVRLSAGEAEQSYRWTLDLSGVTPEQIEDLLSGASSLRVRLQNKYRAGNLDLHEELSIEEALSTVARKPRGPTLAATARSVQAMDPRTRIEFLVAQGLLDRLSADLALAALPPASEPSEHEL